MEPLWMLYLEGDDPSQTTRAAPSVKAAFITVTKKIWVRASWIFAPSAA